MLCWIKLINIRIEDIERIGIPKRTHILALGLGNGIAAEAAGQPRTGGGIEIPANGVGALLIEYISRGYDVADMLAHFLAVLVGNGQLCAGQFLHCGQILLGEFCLDGVIAHNHGRIVQQFPVVPSPEQEVPCGQVIDLGFLQVVAVLVHLLQQTEGNIICQCVAIGGAGFGQSVGIT